MGEDFSQSKQFLQVASCCCRRDLLECELRCAWSASGKVLAGCFVHAVLGEACMARLSCVFRDTRTRTVGAPRVFRNGNGDRQRLHCTAAMSSRQTDRREIEGWRWIAVALSLAWRGIKAAHECVPASVCKREWGRRHGVLNFH